MVRWCITHHSTKKSSEARVSKVIVNTPDPRLTIHSCRRLPIRYLSDDEGAKSRPVGSIQPVDQRDGKWSKAELGHYLTTMIQWLHYLLTKLFQSKKLKVPAVPRQNTHASSSLFFTERNCYECLLDLERWLSLCTAPILAKMKKTSSRKKHQATTSEAPPSCAGEVVEYGVKKRWVKALSNL